MLDYIRGSQICFRFHQSKIKPPKLPDFRGSKSNWLLTSYNSNKITIGEQSNFGTFFENEFEFLSSLGGWNRLIYEDGSAVHLPRGSSSNW